MDKRQDNQRKHLGLLVLLAVGMFGFAFALVPLYDVFCELTGLNGKTGGRQVAEERMATLVAPVSDREVSIQFLSHVARGMPWEFRPSTNELRVRPGEMHTTVFYARNRAGQAVTGQAVPSVAPGRAALHLHKTECFCFNHQRLEAGQEIEMPVTFYVDDDLPDDVHTLSLSYTFYKVGDARTAQLVNHGEKNLLR